jgi:hypothetical protein
MRYPRVGSTLAFIKVAKENVSLQSSAIACALPLISYIKRDCNWFQIPAYISNGTIGDNPEFYKKQGITQANGLMGIFNWFTC